MESEEVGRVRVAEVEVGRRGAGGGIEEITAPVSSSTPVSSCTSRDSSYSFNCSQYSPGSSRPSGGVVASTRSPPARSRVR